MRKPRIAIDAAKALSYVGQTVLIEMAWDAEPESFWQCTHIVGVLLPTADMKGSPYFLGVELSSSTRTPNEIYFDDICTIRAMRYRDRQGSGNVLGRMTLTHSEGSGAALPAHRDGCFVAMNGSTGEAHP
ncbi:hypothetical protein LPB260_23535 [Pseudomonas sp. LPB0260]|uniref:hypothetical protein n=1 Tax=Pseudomonas sp. LPB0260 TaxID=2614442 RepID=UPI0015C26107|nr:hypothetical protein [Pseudomonas sp. LPB0260]QLC73698.1 hypothetical protein LPB260_08585 [Pseudomonas sp. LPB0260]QLC76472.1 hypothetical protein LPB260_23535 [Pseudomonas sp. LPB0260]